MRSANHSELSNALLAISQSLADRSQLAQTLDAVLTAARQMTFAKHGIIYVLDQTGQALIPSTAHHHEKVIASHPWEPLQLDTVSEADPFNFAVRNGEVVLINELYTYNGYDCEGIYQTEQTLGLKSNNLLAWPLIDDEGKTIGLLVLLDLSVIDNETALTEFCRMAASNIRHAIWLEQYGQVIKSLSADNQALVRENTQLKKRTKKTYQGPIAESEEMVNVLSRLDKVLSLPVDVLLRGETGAGKEVIAKYIHENSNRSDQALIVQNCAAIPEQLLESELFGHRKGSFTGADKDKVGLFEAANGGTLFLDEIGDMPMLLQAKLLRVLQERKVRPVGASREIEVDVRVIAATHCNLMQQIKDGGFRADLFYRLNVFPITLPPLRSRQADIIPLAEHFVQQTTTMLGLPQSPGLSANVRNQLLTYTYPGNVRELKNIIERSVLLSDFETITQVEFGEQIPEDVEHRQVVAPATSAIQTTFEPEPLGDDDVAVGLKEVVSQYERTVIIDCLNSCNWHTKRAAEQLSLPLSTLNHKMKKYDISAAG
ncbi:sigma-54-dependent Fis family transcriptional regulator [Vibrio lentus]|uniref:Sigma-54-dependent Fis family transcriptional regulator n=1 Tax=Vibrio lentus TaxID=136468 RepID=A0AA44VQP0_9VIBR|nr:sigma-54-dependent Fis family transcriptional regulator [Vibrio lentus]MCB5360082.1 sigma-54-dependent Fis family transcriptional regulator [Vibrio lentus]MCB5451091.1 sigma-54-dependent Fis family transcriptional regulator [Vibrio lentus]MCB5463400.1 sigma-54-dependent Fis family transcriptional regulator [Vibrio lentus]MCC4793110.1 sigma-54-dependent Fis family transcriptional regulator [Vibrio lentus]MCC4853995.1 sigma-54-dependent Fis family transcriptional regulator [Vibrio lentus]